ncbi:MAG: hypothetical protein Q8P16_01640, partial [bacterium]|nr:hypothetical protein [bacterium]
KGPDRSNVIQFPLKKYDTHKPNDGSGESVPIAGVKNDGSMEGIPRIQGEVLIAVLNTLAVRNTTVGTDKTDKESHKAIENGSMLYGRILEQLSKKYESAARSYGIAVACEDAFFSEGWQNDELEDLWYYLQTQQSAE